MAAGADSCGCGRLLAFLAVVLVLSRGHAFVAPVGRLQKTQQQQQRQEREQRAVSMPILHGVLAATTSVPSSSLSLHAAGLATAGRGCGERRREIGLRMSLYEPGEGTDAMDAVIDALRNVDNASDLSLLVAKNVKTIAQPKFYLRMAEVGDTLTDDADKERLSTLLNDVTAILQDLVELAEKKMDESSSVLNEVLASAAEPDSGEFLVPLSEENVASLKSCMDKNWEKLDGNFLTTIQSYLKKSAEDGLEGMIPILQRVMQLYAAESVMRAKPINVLGNTAEALLDELLAGDPVKWPLILIAGLYEKRSCSKEGLLSALQVAIETTVMTEENGSMAQRVQAEFLAEIASTIQKVAPSSDEENPPPLPTMFM